MWFVYILKCQDQSLYTGITNNLDRRLLQHQNKKGARYTKSHSVLERVYSERLSSRSDALKREAEIKKWSRNKKLQLIRMSA